MSKGKVNLERENKKRQMGKTIIKAHKGTWGRREVREKLKINEQQLRDSKAHHVIG